jgi:hypothetical protein
MSIVYNASKTNNKTANFLNRTKFKDTKRSVTTAGSTSKVRTAVIMALQIVKFKRYQSGLPSTSKCLH